VSVGTAERPEAIGYDAFFREWFPRLVSLGATMTGRRDVAHDAAQEALLRAHRRWDEVAGYGAPGAWVRKVTTNLLLDHLRSAGREHAAVERLGRRGADLGGEPALDRWSDLVAGLPAGQRAIVTLYYADDQSVDAIADVLGIAPGTVKAQLFKAREALRTQLADQLEGER
jgi:RNA polymerase sigma-70 factor (ECF subfamily)